MGEGRREPSEWRLQQAAIGAASAPSALWRKLGAYLGGWGDRPNTVSSVRSLRERFEEVGEGQVSGFEGWGPWLREGRAGLQGHGAAWAAWVPLQIVRNIKYRSRLLQTIKLVIRTSN